MKYLAIKLPGPSGGYEITPPADLKSNFTNLSSLISAILNIAFYIAIFMTFFWLVWGAFQYLSAGGNKETLAKARGRIIWALVGLIIILLSFTASKFISEIFPAKGGLPF